ncbi:MAG: malate synthase A [Caldilineaceae bacterium]|nr:malate synthase A [Caldilineaceae bacterium]
MSQENTPGSAELDVTVVGASLPGSEAILTREALAFVAELHASFNPRRLELLSARAARQARMDAGEAPGFLAETDGVRSSEWQVADSPADLQRRWAEITGPVDRKMVINALNSGADVFMADFEDANSPTWANCVEGQVNLFDAVRREIRLEDEARGRVYELNEEIATLLVRPRGWHLVEKNVLVNGEAVSASLFDVGLYVFHNAAERRRRGTSCYFYLPKLESHLEARLWAEVFAHAEEALGIPHGSFRATVLIETILAALEMEEILYELRDYSAGLNAGRWDYIFSAIKKFARNEGTVLPDRAQVTMTTPFMRAYTELLVRTCHKRGAHAIGGMAAFIPSRRDPEINEQALAKVRADKERESQDGCDGTWVAHPDLVSLARSIFEEATGGAPHQKHRMREDVSVTADQILAVGVPGGTITEEGLRTNIDVSLQYLNAWLLGNGAAAIYNLMEDAATAEISRSQIWQWIRNEARLDDGRSVTRGLYQQIRDEELRRLGEYGPGRLEEAAEILDRLILTDDFVEFLTLIAYDYLN